MNARLRSAQGARATLLAATCGLVLAGCVSSAGLLPGGQPLADTRVADDNTLLEADAGTLGVSPSVRLPIYADRATIAAAQERISANQTITASASGMLNFMRITAGAFGASLATTLWDDRGAMHHAYLSEHISASHPAT